MANYQGDIEMNEAGEIVYVFEDLKNINEESKATQSAWERKYPLLKLNNNSDETNKQIRNLNWFNLVMALITPFYLSAFVGTQGVNEDNVMLTIILTGIVPFIYSVLFFLIPFFRSIHVKIVNKKIKKINQELMVLGEIYKTQEQNFIINRAKVDEIDKILHAPKSNLKITQQLIEKKLQELEAEPQASSDGTYYILPQRFLD